MRINQRMLSRPQRSEIIKCVRPAIANWIYMVQFLRLPKYLHLPCFVIFHFNQALWSLAIHSILHGVSPRGFTEYLKTTDS